jgi:pilus assembly protein CpaB
VVLRKALPANTPVTEDDVLLERLQVVPAGAFQAIDQVIGRTSARPLAAGTWLEESSFEGGGPLARMIRANERAVAIGVDEVIGAAGQMYPGDYVDVLLYLREETSNPQSSAQVVLPALRVLSIGEQMGVANDGRPAQSAEALKARREQGNPGNFSGTRTVVLAVPEALASRLMLAAQVGTLRLAVRSADEQRLAHYWAEHDTQPQVENINRELYRFSQLSQAPLSRSAPVAVVAGMQVIRGAQAAEGEKTP